MRRGCLVYLGAAGLAVAGLAGPARAATVINVATYGADAAGCGSTASPCATIAFAYGQAAPGDTIKVAAGRYVLTASLVISKAGLRLDGAKAGVDARTRTPGGPGETVIAAGFSTTTAQDMLVADADSVRIDGFTFDGNPDGSGVTTSEFHSGYQVSHDIFADNLKGLAPSSNGAIASIFNENLYIGNNNDSNHLGNQGNGVFTFRPLANARFTNSRFLDNGNAPINIAGGEVPGASKDIVITGNNMDGEFGITLVVVSHVVITANKMTGGWNAVQVSGACHDLTITRNTIADKTHGGILLFTGFAAVTNTSITIADNSIEHTATVPGRYGIEVSRSDGVTIRHNLITDSGEGGIGFTARAQDVPSKTASITRNTITGSGGPGIVVAAGTYTGPMTVRFNRIVDNDPHRGLVNDAPTAHIDARLNWWGCNHLPAGHGCDHPAGTDAAQIAYRPWLILTLTPGPAGIYAVPVTGTLRHDSAGTILGGPFFHPVLATFHTNAGTIEPARSLTSTLLTDTSTWRPGRRFATVCVRIDHQTVCIGVRAGTGSPVVIVPVTG